MKIEVIQLQSSPSGDWPGAGGRADRGTQQLTLPRLFVLSYLHLIIIVEHLAVCESKDPELHSLEKGRTWLTRYHCCPCSSLTNSCSGVWDWSARGAEVHPGTRLPAAAVEISSQALALRTSPYIGGLLLSGRPARDWLGGGQ